MIQIAYQEIRVNVRDPEQTHCYVLIDDLNNTGTPNIQGWHYKAFPATMSLLKILELWEEGMETPLAWPMSCPPHKG